MTAKSHVKVKRVKTERVVDGPQPVQCLGKTLIVPAVSEVLQIEKQLVCSTPDAIVILARTCKLQTRT